MSCRKVRKSMPALLCGELGEAYAAQVENHCRYCAECRAELEELRGVFSAADTLRPEIDAAVDSVDWEILPQRIAASREREPGRNPGTRKLRFLATVFQPGARPVLAGILIGILLGAAAMLVLLRNTQGPPPALAQAVMPQGFLEKVELELTRRDTIDYLEQSEYLLLDFIQDTADRSSEFWGSELSVRRTQDLLSKKKYINPQLDKYKMAKAKAICDQIELLFYELTQLREDLDTEEMEELRGYIEQKQILLKIKLVKKELEQSDV